MDRGFGDIGNQKNINAYNNDVPIKSYYRESDKSKKFSLSSSKFEPNFQSDVYKEQAKRSFQRRMNYDARDSITKSKERLSPLKNNQSPERNQMFRINERTYEHEFGLSE